MRVGIVVRRFQVSNLHKGHMALLTKTKGIIMTLQEAADRSLVCQALARLAEMPGYHGLARKALESLDRLLVHNYPPDGPSDGSGISTN